MRFIFALVFVLLLVGVVVYASNPDNFDKITNVVTRAAVNGSEKFIDTSNKYTSLAIYWASGRQASSTSGSAEIDFAADILRLPDANAKVEPESLVKQKEDERGMSASEILVCEENFKLCVDKVNRQYGTYISVKEVYVANSEEDYIKSASFYGNHKSASQSGYPIINDDFPAMLIWGNALGLGDFVAVCDKNGEYPTKLNAGLPC